MTKSDFKVGQTVYLLQVLNCSRLTIEERIRKVDILSVGRKYITVNFYGEMKFDITDKFRQVTQYAPSYRLYLSKDQIYEEIKRRSAEDRVVRAFRWEKNLARMMALEDLETVLDIVNKYESDNTDC